MTASSDGSDSKAARKLLSAARNVVAHHVGSARMRVTRQLGGLRNRVCAVTHPHEGELIVRMSPTPEGIESFRKEERVMRCVRQLGVPVAEVLHVGNEAIDQPYMLQRRVRGQEATFHPDRARILPQLGRYAAQIHSVRTLGFGSSLETEAGAQAPTWPTWSEYLHAELALAARLEALERHHILPHKKLERVRAILESAQLQTQAPALNHGDLRLKNVMVDDSGTITAILDWEDAVSSLAPQWDWSIALHDLSIDDKQAFLEGYGAPRPLIAEHASTLAALNIVNYVPAIEQAAEQGDEEKLEWVRIRTGGALDLYSL
jgi:aminoglycoside phosphotransferase (APT) family kinase protein